MKTDEELAHSLQRGDQKACTELYERYVRPIYRFALAKTSNQAAAEDLTHDVFIRMIDRISTFRGNSFKSWLYTIARNIITDYWRESYRAPTVPLEDFLGFHSDPPDIFAEPDDDRASKEAAVRSLLARLPQNYSAILELRFLKDYTLQQAADELRITLTNAKVLQHRALKKASSLLTNAQ